MKKIAYIILETCFAFLLPFLLFIGIFSANQNGSTSEFEPGTPQEQVALEVAQYVQQKEEQRNMQQHGSVTWNMRVD